MLIVFDRDDLDSARAELDKWRLDHPAALIRIIEGGQR